MMCTSTARILTLTANNLCTVVIVDSTTEVSKFPSVRQHPANAGNCLLRTRYLVKRPILSTCTLQSLSSSASLDKTSACGSLCCDSPRLANAVNSVSSSLPVRTFFALWLMPPGGTTGLAGALCAARQAQLQHTTRRQRYTP